MDSVNSFGHDQSIKPIPKPRRLRETVSLDNIEPPKSFRPVPYPRKLIGAFGLVEGPRLRANPPERPLPRPLFAFDATVVASGQLAQVDNSSSSVGSSDDGTSKDTVAESAIEVQRSSIEPSTELIDYPDSSKDVIDYSEERLCDKSKTRGECARPSPDMDSIRVMVEDITTKSGDDSRYSPTLRPEFSVPEEYATSPIVAELAHSADDRPRPPKDLCFLMRSQSFQTSRGGCSGYSGICENRVNLFEQIVRSHPIWYLRHIGRPTATHMLSQMQPGNFIVRGASRVSDGECMALSVRLAPGQDADVDHYILVQKGRTVRLDTSLNSFDSLPSLIQYYCLNGHELQIALKLPEAILHCKSTKELQQISLLGQDFWTSERAMSLSRCSSRATVSGDLATNRPGNLAPAMIMQDRERTMTRHRAATERSGGGRFATIHGDVMASVGNLSQCNSYATEAFESNNIGRAERRSQSQRGTKRCDPNSSISGRSSTGRRSFLKNLSSIFGQDRDSNSRQQQYFVPRKQLSTRSALDISDPQPFNHGEARHGPLRDAKEMKTFKPIHGYDEVLSSARVRPLAMRRERSDLCASSVQRLARHTERSPGPPSKRDNIHSSPERMSRNGKKQPMRPPATVDENALRQCVEELKRKRLPTASELLQGPEEVREQDVTNVQMRNPSRTSSCMSKDLSSCRKDHRLSVPNLVLEPPSSVLQNAKALMEKLGRKADGELATINEGLITPVIRRKHLDQSGLHDYRYAAADREEGGICGGTVARGRDILEAMFENGVPKPESKSSITPLRESELVWRRGGRRSSDQPIKTEKSPPTETETHISPPAASKLHKSPVAATRDEHQPTPVAAPRVEVAGKCGDSRGSHLAENTGKRGDRGSCYFPNKPSACWSSVNTELKNRQRVAKVRPTPQQRPQGMTVAATQGTASDYAHITELVYDLPTRRESCVPCDEDAVSVAGTVFNEPWDSNVWENLLDLGQDSNHTRVSEAIAEEETDSDGATGSSMRDSDEEVDAGTTPDWKLLGSQRRLPSDCVINKAWDNDSSSRFSTVDSRISENGKNSSSLRRRLHSAAVNDVQSMHSLPRAISRFSQVGSMDDIPTSLPSLSPLLNGNRAKERKTNEPGTVIQLYVESLAVTQRTVFGATLRRFVECATESGEGDPAIVFRNVRQFINGMKNYLVKHGEGELHGVIEQERGRLQSNQILSIDAILEAVLHKLLLRQVKCHLYQLMIREQTESGALLAITSNIRYVKELGIQELGFSKPQQYVLPEASVMEQIGIHVKKMISHYSPLKKLENLLRAVGLFMQCQRDEENNSTHTAAGDRLPPADDLVRWLVLIMARTGCVGCEAEATYMWELLPQHMITNGDAAYYLTALFSAVHVLKSKDAILRLTESRQIASLDLSRQCPSPSSDAFLRIAIPDTNAGCIRYATFPGVPSMTAAKLCRVIGYQQGITNPEDFALYLVLNGTSGGIEVPLAPTDCVDVVRDRMRDDGKPHLFAYKRQDSHIAWPVLSS